MDDLSHAIGRLGSVSPGPDRVPAEVLKELPMEMKQQLLQEINTSVTAGAVPPERTDCFLVPRSQAGEGPSSIGRLQNHSRPKPGGEGCERVW